MQKSTWKDLLKEWRPEYVLLTSATNGLKPQESQLIGVFYTVVTPDYHIRSGELLKDLPDSELEKSYAYHGITTERVRKSAIGEEQFNEELLALLRGRPVFVYNPTFQQGFIPQLVLVNDFARLYTAAARHFPVTKGTPIYEILQNQQGRIPTRDEIFRNTGVTQQMVANSIPPINALHGMELVWSWILAQEVPVLEE